jgi:hypothetical protein
LVVELEMEAVREEVLEHDAKLVPSGARRDGGVDVVAVLRAVADPEGTGDLVDGDGVGLHEEEREGGAGPCEAGRVVRAGAAAHPILGSGDEGSGGLDGGDFEDLGENRDGEEESGEEQEFHGCNSSGVL